MFDTAKKKLSGLTGKDFGTQVLSAIVSAVIIGISVSLGGWLLWLFRAFLTQTVQVPFIALLALGIGSFGFALLAWFRWGSTAVFGIRRVSLNSFHQVRWEGLVDRNCHFRRLEAICPHCTNSLKPEMKEEDIGNSASDKRKEPFLTCECGFETWIPYHYEELREKAEERIREVSTDCDDQT